MVAGSDSRQQQQFGGAHGAGRHDDLFTSLDRRVLPVLGVQHTHRALLVEKNLQHKVTGSRWLLAQQSRMGTTLVRILVQLLSLLESFLTLKRSEICFSVESF